MHALARCLALAVLTLPCAAGTWVVDDDGGPGVDFTDLPPAIAAAAPGDAVLVLPGQYSAFVLDKPLALVAPGGAVVQGLICRFFGLPAGTTTTVSGVTFQTDTSLSIQDCLGTLVIDGSTVAGVGMSIVRAKDLRLRATLVEDGVFVFPESRVEVNECTILRSTVPGPACPSSDGNHALTVSVGSRVHVYRSWVEGGQGGDGAGLACNGGMGGAGIVVTSGDLLLAGDPVHTVLGGAGGSGLAPGLDGQQVALTSSAHGRVSGATAAVSTGPAATLETPVPRDPSLFVLDQVGPAQSLALRVQTEPGATVELMLGRMPALGTQAGSSEVLLIVPLRTFQLGAAPAGGLAGLDFLTPAHLTTGFTYFAQGRVTFQGGEQRYTNSVPVVVQ